MRISKADVQIREAFVKEFFRKEGADSTVAAANEAVKAKFGKMMRAVRMYELRAEVAAEKPAEKPAEAPVAAPAPEAAPVVEAPAAATAAPVEPEPKGAARTANIMDADEELQALLNELVEED